MNQQPDLLAEVQGLLRRISESGQAELALEEGVEERARLLAEHLRDYDDLAVRHTLGWLFWFQHLALPEGRDEESLRKALDMLDACFLVDIGNIPEPLLPSLADRARSFAVELAQRSQQSTDPALATLCVELWVRILSATAEDHPEWAGRLSNLGNALLARFWRSGVMADLEEAVQVGKIAVEATPENHPDRAAMLSNLGSALQSRFGRTGVMADLDEAVRVDELAVKATSEDHPARASRLSNLGSVLQARFERTGELADLDEAVRLGELAAEATPENHPERGGRLSNLGNALQSRFGRTGVMADLDEAVQVGRLAIQTTPENHPDQAGMLSNLGNTLLTRFWRTGVMADLDEAVQVGRLAVQATPENHPDQAIRLSNLASALQSRFGRTGVMADLDEAVQVGRLAIQTTPENHPDQAGMLSNLGNALRTRFRHTGVLADLDDAVRVGGLAVAAAVKDHPGRAGMLSNLGIALQSRFDRTGVIADLDEAVRIGELAVQATPEDHPNLAGRLSHVGSALQSRFERTGVLADLDEAVRLGELAVNATPENHLERLRRLSNLGSLLRARFERTGVLADLDEAVRLGELAVEATPENHPDRATMLSNLGGLLMGRFGRTGVLADLDEAVQVVRLAVQATPEDHPGQASRLSNLGGLLQSRFGRTGVLADLDEAVQVVRLAVQATPEDQPSRAGMLSNLGLALQSQFAHSGVLADLDEAIRIGEAAVSATPQNHPDRAGRLANLGGAFRIRFERTGVATDLDGAVARYEQAANTGSATPSTRIQAARLAARLLADLNPSRAAGLLETAVRLLPEVASYRLHRSDQQYALGGFAGLASEAAALALLDMTVPEQQRAERALSLLEAGRAVLLSQALGTRNDVTDLHTQHPELAQRFTELRELLNRDPEEGLFFENPGATPLTRPAGSDRAETAEQLATLFQEIRTLPEFQDFGLPPSTDQLIALAAPGPVVSFTISEHYSAALILTEHGVSALALPGLTLDALVPKINAFHRALRDARDPYTNRTAANTTLTSTLQWLWDQAAGPVLECLGCDCAPADGQPWPRVWWATGGLLGLLPLHAAGHHDDPPTPERRTVPDRVVSSYTPTARTLSYARRPRSVPDSTASSLIVAMPTTPDLPAALNGAPLYHVPTEAQRVAALLPRPLTLIEPAPVSQPGNPATALSAEPPTRQRVLEVLSNCTIAHFACHGTNDAHDPSTGRLLLHDHLEYPLTVASLAPVNLEHAQLAYLSACNTAANTATALLDEAIHLAGAFQLAGFPHIIGTLWPIDDEFAVDVAIGFYTTLKDQRGQLNTDNAASALHQTLRTLIHDQDLHATPSLWAPYIHAGA